ncbi:hypothetical protein [Allosphingosinicella sp.]|uniref:hypothetical protein n=1 Tax=Allosphingosinicella sp. TaxID=2823234 RepID=UPI002FC0E056
MNRINAEFAGLALLAAILSVAGTVASTGAPLYATTFQTEVGYTASTPQGADTLKVRYGLS